MYGARGQSLAVGSLGPYRDTGLRWPAYDGGKGHNVTALALPGGDYAVVVSETRNGDVFTARTLDGPWRRLGSITVDQSAFVSVKTPGDRQAGATRRPWRASNVTILARPGGGYQIVQHSGQILVSRSGLPGPYKVMGDSVYRDLPGIPQTDMRAFEDPVVWHSGGWYHIIVNHWRDRNAYHLMSRDGIGGWRVQGLAYTPHADFIRYPDGTLNHWNKLERPGVVIEKGHVVAMTFAVVDTPKEMQTGGNGHGSKVIVVPFDGAAMDRDLAHVDQRGAAVAAACPKPGRADGQQHRKIMISVTEFRMRNIRSVSWPGHFVAIGLSGTGVADRGWHPFGFKACPCRRFYSL